MRESDVRTGSAAGGQRFGNGLVVAEVALACCLLIGAGLLIRNLLALEARVTGFETERRVAFDIAPTGPRYADREQRMQLYRDLQARFEAIPSVERVGSTSHLPMYQFGWNGEVYLESGNPWQPDVAPLVEFRWVGGDYFQTMGIRLLSGRLLDENDREGTAQVTVINRRAAEMFWPGGNPLGRRFSRGSPENDPYEVVGVVEDVRGRGLLLDGGYEMYIPIGQDTFQWQTFVLHASAEDPLSVIPQARAIVGEVDPQLPVSEIQTLSAVVSESVNQPRLVSSLALLFGALAALLAAVGVYGVMAYNVRRQRREFGIRLALGADPARVQRLVALRGAVLGALGVAIGTGAALVLTRYIESLLNDVQPRDPVAYLASAAGLLTVTVLAGYLPARQASKTDPMVVLRLD